MEFSNKLKDKHDGLLFFASFGYMFIGSVLFLIPLLLILNYTDPTFVLTQDYFQSEAFFVKSMLAESASKILLIVFFLFVFFKELKENVTRAIKEWAPNLVYIIGGIIIMFILLNVLTRVYQFFGIEGDSQNQDILIQATNSSIRPFMFFMIVIFAPFVEEIIFRKLLFGFCEKTLKLSKWWAFAISTFVFAAIHVIADVDSYIFIFQYLVLSGIISLSYVLSRKNIIVPMGIHFLNNLLSYIEIIL